MAEEGLQAPPITEGAKDPPAHQAPQQPAPHMPPLNWSHFMPKFSGKQQKIHEHIYLEQMNECTLIDFRKTIWFKDFV